MSNINLRLYGEQIYPNISKYLSKYISPEISKEEFISSYKNGILEFKSLKLKEKLLLHPQISIEEASIDELKINVPNETENLEIHINNIKCFLLVSELEEGEIEKIMINDRKKLIDEFIKYAINKIEKKDGPSFLDNIIKSVIDKILNGFIIDINNLELKISCKTHNNVYFIFNTDNANFNCDKGVKFKNMSLTYQEDLMKTTVFDKFDFNLDIIYENEEKNEKNKICINASEIKLQINKKIYFDFIYIWELFSEAEYKKIYLQYKKLIQYNRPKNNKEGKKDYKALWIYSIRTVIKLQKYVQDNKENIFDLKYITQIKLIKEYLENNQKDENILLPDIKNILINTKETVEKKVLENKKGNFFAKSFSFFFGKKEDDKKEELTEEEIELSNKIYEEENINKYLKKELNIGESNLSSIIDKIKIFFSNFSTEINFEKLELILENSSKTQNLFIKGMKSNFNYFNKEFDFNFCINDIGFDKDKSFFEKEDIFNGDVISLTRNKQNFINLNFGFKNIELNEDLFVFLLSFGNSIKRKKRIKLFHDKKSEGIIDDKKKEEMINDIKNFSLLNNFKLSNIPSFSIKSINNTIDFKITNYSINENSINFILNIKDSYSSILNDFCFNPKKENNKFVFHLDKPLEINLLSESSKIFFLNYLKYKKELSINNNILNNKKIENELFGFNYRSYTNIDIGKLDMNDYILEIIINKIDIKIFEEKENYKSNFVMEDFKLLYQNKNMDINLNKIYISANLMSTMILYLIDFESPLLEKYKKKANLDNKETNQIINMVSGVDNQEKAKNIAENDLQISNIINYSQLLEQILNGFNFNLNIFTFDYQSKDFILSLNLYNIIASKNIKEKGKICLCASIEKWNVSIEAPKINIKNKNIIENNQKILLDYDFNVEIIKGEMKSIYFNMSIEEVFEIWENTKFILNQINWDIVLCKMDFKIDDFVVILGQFKYIIPKIMFINFKDINAKDNAFYFKIFDFTMTNQKGNKIIYEKELKIDYLFTSSTENDIEIKFNNNLNIELSQQDIYSLFTYIKIPDKDIGKDNLKRLNTSVQNVPLIQLKDGINKDIIKIKNSSKLVTKVSDLEQSKQKKKIFSLSLNLYIPKLNICFCLNDYSKIGEISIEESNVKMKDIFYENLFNDEPSNDLSYRLFLGKFNFVYYYDKNNTINILSKREIFADDENIDKNIIKDENNNNKDKNNINQVEIVNDKNGYLININKNEIKFRIDALIKIYYYFKNSIPIEEITDNFEKDLNVKSKNSYLQIQFNLNDSEIQFCTSFSGEENLCLDINKITIIYTGNKGLPYGNYIINLNQLTAKINMENNTREVFYTSEQFLQIKLTFIEELFSAIVEMDKLIINLSYLDLISFYRAYLLNFKILNDSIKIGEEFLNSKEKRKINNNEIKNINKGTNKINNHIINSKTKTPGSYNNIKLSFSGEFNFEKLEITLIDNTKGSYHPFMNIINNKIYLVLNPDNSIEASFSFQFFSYNYIACVWEPTIENTKIKFNNSYSKQRNEISNKMKLEIDNININLSDMAISFTLMSLNNWIDKFSENKKNLQNENKKVHKELKDETKLLKTTNNKVINYTGIEFKIIHNGKILDCPLMKPVELEYIIYENKRKKKKINYITLIYDENNKFEIPLEKITTLKHTINNELSFISDNTLSENRTINIILYSTFIFKNKSIYPLQIIIENPEKNETYETLSLNPNSITGIPLKLINKQNNFKFALNETKEDDKKKNSNYFSDSYNISAFQDLDFSYSGKIKFKNVNLKMKLDNKIPSVHTIILNSEYSIINCLPCNLTIRFSSKKEIIKKCTQYYINENYTSDLHLAFSINTGEGEFNCDGFKFLDLAMKKSEDKFLLFKKGNKSFKISFDFKQNDEENILIIYAEYILYNKTGIVLSVKSKDKDGNILCYGVENNISLISSKFDYNEAYMQFINEKLCTKMVKLSSLIEKSPYSELEMRSESGDILVINVKKKFSYINIINNPNFKDNIMSLVFTIFPSCVITNLLPDSRFFVCDYQFQNNQQIIKPYNKSNFHYYGHGRNAQLGISTLNMTSNKCYHLIKFRFQIGVYTLSTFDQTFNLEIRRNPSNGCIDVFVIPNNLENSKIIVENLSSDEIRIYQKNYEKYTQILQQKDIQALKLFDPENFELTIETSKSVCEIDFKRMEEPKKPIILNDIVLLIQDNGIKMKLIFYNTKEYNNILKSGKDIKNINSFEFVINSILISLIGDNEFQDKNLTSYHRYELLLITLRELSVKIIIDKITGVLNKDCIKSEIDINNFEIHNQVSEKGKFPCILNNVDNKFLSLANEIDYYDKLKIVKMRRNKIEISKLELGIDPKFFIELIDFFGNILYRMNITNFIVNEIFQIDNEVKTLEEKKNELIKEYKQSRILLNAKNYEIPKLNIRFELTNVGIRELLKERIGCSEFYYWIVKGLIGRAHSLILEPSKYPYSNGGLGYFFKGLLYHIRAKLENKIMDIGFKGLIGQFKNMFSYGDSNMDMKNNRFREKRAFYGKFKYFKEYSKQDAYFFNSFYEKNKHLKNKYFPLRIIFGVKNFFLFTSISLLIIDYKNYSVVKDIYYFSIKEIKIDKFKVDIEYNQKMDSEDRYIIHCENETIANNISDSLNEEMVNNKQTLDEL